MVPNNGESDGKENGNEMETGIIYGLYYIIALDLLFVDFMVPNTE